ncbi:tRNA dimethylallyltransferase 2 isoform X1 [Cynara cardunculus var. scolymus]|uniref:tRNA dimethylallyltransferase 2 isoform X1 n=1 Tax=Cynara cardunculus var. scolymus TaxID=59895 RepID=UPI000D62BAB7|nr:tRNA dimethylallyltransferase 2 isoform X1 [Cynara cardunculus var. scolymus]XP_024983911.1 tRNA dimethylallyltransferase 2 isoform X1 [Cynara cardunculus var. scolymus]
MEMEGDSLRNPNGVPNQKGESRIANSKPKLVVIMGATGSGKSRLAIDLASLFPIEIINADSMQVYEGLDVLTNKVPLHDQRGVPHHLLGTISPMVEFTAKDFRDYAIPLINDITSRNHLPVIVGGTNYYIQALVSHFLLDDSLEDTDESCLGETYGDKQQHIAVMPEQGNFSYSYDSLKDLDPVAANRIHPNDHRKIRQYLRLYACSGVLPSKYLQEQTMENWGNADSLRYNCCFICVDASLTVIDKYVEQRVDQMVDSGLLQEVYDIFNPDADYTRGLRQAIGVREFEHFLKAYLSVGQSGTENGIIDQVSAVKYVEKLKENMNTVLSTAGEDPLKQLLQDAIDKVKLNTKRLVRRQKRRLVRLQTLFGWKIHYVDATKCLSCLSEESWTVNVVEPSIQIIKSYFDKSTHLVPDFEASNDTKGSKLIDRDLWTQHICKACGNKVLRGAYEWEQHKQGRSHRKRVCRLRKSGVSGLDD